MGRPGLEGRVIVTLGRCRGSLENGTREVFGRDGRSIVNISVLVIYNSFYEYLFF